MGMGSEDVRTLESVRSAILHELASKKMISGDHDFYVGLQKIIQESMTNTDFKMILDGLAAQMLLLFPVQKKKTEKKNSGLKDLRNCGDSDCPVHGAPERMH